MWENKEKLSDLPRDGNWAGLFFVLVGLLVGIAGELATLFIITQYAFLLTLYGLCLSLVGWRGVRLLWFPLAYLIFMIPLPGFLYNSLSAYLQLISSSLGVSFIRFCDISVFLEGNVIDLGTYKLQVVEACSGGSVARVIGSEERLVFRHNYPAKAINCL
jgi:exosortase